MGICKFREMTDKDYNSILQRWLKADDTKSKKRKVAKFIVKFDESLVDKLFPDPFQKNQNWAYLWINIVKFYMFFFFVCQAEDYRKWLKLSCRPLAFPSYKAFLKNNKRCGISPLPHFLYDFWRKMFLWLYSITWPDFNVWLPLLLEILGNMYHVIVC